jgi:hypothetical protein
LAAAAAAAAEIECLSFKKMNMTMLQPNYTCQLANFEKYTFFSFLRRVGFFIFGLGRGRPWASPVLKGARARRVTHSPTVLFNEHVEKTRKNPFFFICNS